ncbi:MAG: hypothetical protein IT430_02510 [Phycisphaerales bacterium]|nr:hypothetical protein [Phycisphaerales bacterium]
MLTRMRTSHRRFVGVLANPILFASLMAAASHAAPPCGSWELVPTPDVGNSVTRLTGVSALSPDDAWAVGIWRNDPVGYGPLAVRWNGAAWSLVDLPDTSHLGTSPQTTGVDAAPNGDVWVVGYLTTPYPTNNLPLVLRWRGNSWNYVDTVTLRPQTVYPFGPRGGFLYEVDAVTADDIWAVGLAAGYGDASATSVPLAAHWDGSDWTDIEVPLVANRHHELTDVVAIASDDVWAVGDYRNVAGPFLGVTYHWDGQSWSHVDSPVEHMGSSGLDDIAASGPNDVWALGGGDGAVVLKHWNGSQWSLRQPPPNSGGSIAAVGPDDVWVSGWYGYWHWDGSTWTEVPAEVPGASYVIRSGGIDIVGECDLWCVGFWTLPDGTTSFTLAERLGGAGAFRLSSSRWVAGAIADLEVSGASPGGRVAFIYSLRGSGSTYIPQLDVTIDLSRPLLAGVRTADQSGYALLQTRIPSGASGRRAWLQAAEYQRASNVIEQVIE